MPFDPAPRQPEVNTREALGRKALAVIAERVLYIDPREFHMGKWTACAMGNCHALPEVTATGLQFGIGAQPRFAGRGDYVAIGGAFGIGEGVATDLFSPMAYDDPGDTGENVRREQVSARIRDFLAATA